MRKALQNTQLIVASVWLLVLVSVLYVYFFHQEFLHMRFARIAETSIFLAYAVLLLVGSLRGFVLIPATYLIVLGLLFFPPWPLYFIIVAGIMISSVSVYYFSEFLHLDSLFENKYHRQVAWVRRGLQKYELPIIIGWSACPFLPTDLICYICGTLRVNMPKFLLGLFIGETVMCAVYIFVGHRIMEYLQVAPLLQ